MTRQLLRISKYRPSALQGSLQFSSRSLAVAHPFESVALRMLAALLTVLICAYLYFVTASVLNVMASRAMSDEATQIQGSIGSMETEYFALSQEVTPQEGKALGLGPVSQTYYVYRPGNVGAASAATIARNAI